MNHQQKHHMNSLKKHHMKHQQKHHMNHQQKHHMNHINQVIIQQHIITQQPHHHGTNQNDIINLSQNLMQSLLQCQNHYNPMRGNIIMQHTQQKQYQQSHMYPQLSHLFLKLHQCLSTTLPILKLHITQSYHIVKSLQKISHWYLISTISPNTQLQQPPLPQQHILQHTLPQQLQQQLLQPQPQQQHTQQQPLQQLQPTQQLQPQQQQQQQPQQPGTNQRGTTDP